jgi:hypothetical protein
MGRPAMRGLASVAAIGLLGMIAMTSAGCLLDYEPPPKPVSNWTVEQARRFNEFQVYWLGESYEGLRLTSMRLTSDGDDVTHTTFFYGEPSLVDGNSGQSWEPPLEVDIQPYCGFSPEEFLEHAGDGVIGIQIRGVDGYLERYSDNSAYLVLWTGSSTIYLSTGKTDLDIEQVARDLIPIAGSAGAPPPPFPPPITTSC